MSNATRRAGWLQLRRSIQWRLMLAIAVLNAVPLAPSFAAGTDERMLIDIQAVDLSPERLAKIDERMHVQVRPDTRRKPSEPLPQLLNPADRLAFDLAQHKVRRADGCDDDGFATKSGDALVAHIRSSSYRCLNRLFSDAPGSVRFAAFRARNMVDVAGAVESLARTYAGTNVTNLTEFFLFLRIGYFTAFYDYEDLDWSDQRAEIDGAVVAALDAFVENAHFYDTTEAHAGVLYEAIT